jgi:hypothetical protein
MYCLHLQCQRESEVRNGKKQVASRAQLLLAGLFLGLLFDPEDGGSAFLWSAVRLLPDYAVLHSRR